MFNVIIAIGAILVLIIIVMIFRIQALLGVAKGRTEKKGFDIKSNRMNAMLMLLFLIFAMIALFWYSYTRFNEYVLPVASEHGVKYETLFWITTGITGAVFILTHILLFYFPYKYQYRENKRALFYPDNTKLEIIWTLVPAVTLAILVFSGWKVWNDITSKAPGNAEEIEILGYQFAWSVRYPGQDKKLGSFDYRMIDGVNEFGLDLTDRANFDDFTVREIHVPKGQPVLFRIRARDVLHSVYAPHFRLKMDAVPGMPTKFWFTPTKSTADMRAETNNPDFNYELACAEVCGRGHFSMKLIIVVDEPADYQKWFAQQVPWVEKNKDYLAKKQGKANAEVILATGTDNQ